VSGLHPAHDLAEDQRADLVAKDGEARVGLKPFVSVGRLTLRVDREPVEIGPAHFAGSGNGATGVQIQSDQRGLTKFLFLDDLHRVEQVLIGVERAALFDDVLTRDAQRDGVICHDLRVVHAEHLIIARGHDELRFGKSLPPFIGKLDLCTGGTCGHRRAFQGVGGDDKTARMRRWVVGDEPEAFEEGFHFYILPYLQDIVMTLQLDLYPHTINLGWIMEPQRLSKFEIVRRLFRRFSTSNVSEEEKLGILKRIMTKLSTSILSPSEIKEAIIRLTSRLK